MVLKIIGFFSIALFLFEADSINQDFSFFDGYLFIDVVMPFPDTPDKTQLRIIEGVTVRSSFLSPQDSHINYVATAYQDVSEIEDSTPTIINGFISRHDIITRRKIEVRNQVGTYVKLKAENPRKAIWNLFAFEYKRNVYIWIETFEPHDRQGDEDENFLKNIENIRFE